MDTVIRTTTLTAPRLIRSRPGWLLFAANAAALVAALVAIFTLQTPSTSMRVGEVAGETVVAQRKITFADRLATQARQQQAENQVAIVYLFDPTGARQRRSQARTFLAGMAKVLTGDQPPALRQVAIQRLLPPDISPTSVLELTTLAPGDFGLVQSRTLALLDQAVDWHFSAEQKQTIDLALLSSIPSTVSLAQRTAIGQLLNAFLTPTNIADPPATAAKRKQAAAHVPTQYSTLYAGQVIIRRGDLVTPAVVEELAALGLQDHRTSWRDVASSLLFASAIIIMLLWYLHAFQSSILASPRLLFLIDAAILLTVATSRLITGGHVLLPYLLPVAATSTFAAVLIAPEACIAMSLAIALLAGWVVANSFELTVYYFLTASAGVLVIRQVRQLKQFMIAGVFITAFALATTISFGLADRTYDLAALREQVLAAGFNGFVSSALALGAFALLSGYFGVTTTLQLFELGQPNQPLLRRLVARAPGTYNHSVVVAGMVEQAAEAIGANSLAAKVGALYHDVGKTANPHCFVENQMGIANIHDELRSDESARIIRGHVTQGLRLAHQYKLPRVVLDAIAEHHGTMPLAYFLHKAQQEAEGMPVDQALYHYPGPKPQTRETALLMLADGCESAVRSSADHSHERIDEIVRQILRERVEGEQLNECPLTLQDLELVRRAFGAALHGLYHPRIEYPDPAELGVTPARG